MVAMSRDLGLAYKSAFVLCHKMREAMAEEMKGRVIGDDHDEASVDGAYFGGHIRPANIREHRIDRRLWKNQNGKRKVVVVIREHGGETLPGVFASEGAALSWIKSRVQKGTKLNADEAASWNGLHDRFAWQHAIDRFGLAGPVGHFAPARSRNVPLRGNMPTAPCESAAPPASQRSSVILHGKSRWRSAEHWRQLLVFAFVLSAIARATSEPT
jgi:ISXO2-like transposase domain